MNEQKKNVYITVLILTNIILLVVVVLILNGTLSLSNNTNQPNNNPVENSNKEEKNEEENEISTEKESNSTQNNINISMTELMNLYREKINLAEYYAIADINEDGIPELMTTLETTKELSNGASLIINYTEFYTYNNELISAGTLMGTRNTSFYKMKDHTLLAVYGHMNSEQVTTLKLENNWMTRINTSSRDVPQNEGYREGDEEIKFVSSNDTSVINSYK